MRTIIKVLAVLSLTLALNLEAGSTYVKGYTKKNGTVVMPHYRSSPDKTKSNNWSTKGNINPYTGKMGTKSPYNNYETNTSYPYESYKTGTTTQPSMNTKSTITAPNGQTPLMNNSTLGNSNLMNNTMQGSNNSIGNDTNNPSYKLNYSNYKDYSDTQTETNKASYVDTDADSADETN